MGRKEAERRVWLQEKQSDTHHFQIFFKYKKTGLNLFSGSSSQTGCGTHWTLAKVKVLLDLLFSLYILCQVDFLLWQMNLSTTSASFNPCWLPLWCALKGDTFKFLVSVLLLQRTDTKRDTRPRPRVYEVRTALQFLMRLISDGTQQQRADRTDWR